MEDIGNDVMVDFPDKPSVFLVKGLGEIRVQKGNTRVNGVTLEQLKTIVKALQPKKVKEPIIEEDIGEIVHGAIDDALGELLELEEAVKSAETKEDKKAARKKLKDYKANQRR